LKGGVTKCALFTPEMALTLLKVACVLVRLNHIACFIVNADHGIPRHPTSFVADAHRDDGNRFVVHADEKLAAFLELEAVTRTSGRMKI